jgi:hypothetical protein
VPERLDLRPWKEIESRKEEQRVSSWVTPCGLETDGFALPTQISIRKIARQGNTLITPIALGFPLSSGPESTAAGSQRPALMYEYTWAVTPVFWNVNW